MTKEYKYNSIIYVKRILALFWIVMLSVMALASNESCVPLAESKGLAMRLTF